MTEPSIDPRRRTDYISHRVVSALDERERASERLEINLRLLEGRERLEALKACRDAGIGATELAQLAGFSRARLYQLLDKETKETHARA